MHPSIEPGRWRSGRGSRWSSGVRRRSPSRARKAGGWGAAPPNRCAGRQSARRQWRAADPRARHLRRSREHRRGRPPRVATAPSAPSTAAEAPEHLSTVVGASAPLGRRSLLPVQSRPQADARRRRPGDVSTPWTREPKLAGLAETDNRKRGSGRARAESQAGCADLCQPGKGCTVVAQSGRQRDAETATGVDHRPIPVGCVDKHPVSWCSTAGWPGGENRADGCIAGMEREADRLLLRDCRDDRAAVAGQLDPRAEQAQVGTDEDLVVLDISR